MTTAIGPARFQSPADPPPGRSLLQTVGAALALVLLVIGVPVGLLLLSGAPPLPTSLPSRASLSAPIGLEAVVTVLLAVVWLAWLHFTVCVAIEVVAALRGHSLPHALPLAGPNQRLARMLVATLLISAAMAGQASAAVGLDRAPSVATTTTMSADVTPGAHTAAVTASAHKAAPAEHVSAAALAALPENERALVGRRVYTVEKPANGYHDNLWDIAERHLGDGRRYREVYELNAGRLQSDGRPLELARLIRPGWQLVMPEDAVGVDRYVAPAIELHEPAAGPTGAVRSDGPSVAHGPSLAAVTGAGAGAGAVENDSSAGGALASSAVADHLDGLAGDGLAAGGLLAAGILSGLVLARRRRAGSGSTPDRDAVLAEVALRVGANASRAAWLDAALRSLAATCLEEGRALPAAYAVVADDETVQLLLAPAVTRAPGAWAVRDEGRLWVLQRGDATTVPASTPSPYPALVSVGHDADDRDVLIDLEAADGPIAITGDSVAASQVAAALVLELATNPWSDGLQVAASGVPAEVAVAARGLVQVLERSSEVLDLVASRAPALGTDVLTGRLRAPMAPASSVQVAVLALATTPDLVERVTSLTGGGRSGVAVVAVGDLVGARWRLHVDDAGSLRVEPLAITVTANRLTPGLVAGVAGLFAAAGGPSGVRPEERDGSRPRVPAVAGTGSGDDSAWAAAAARVGLLGEPLVRCPGALDPSRVDLATELVSFLALHPGGVHPSVLGSALWPRGVTVDVRDATVARSRDWLGVDEAGTYRLRADAEGRLSLAGDVVVDWDVVRSLLARSRTAATVQAEADLLRRGLHLVRGPLGGNALSAMSGRWAWIARTGLERTVEALVIDAAHRLSQLELDSDPGAGGAASRAGLRGAPAAQLLWRDVLRAEHAQWGGGGVRTAFDEMQSVLSRLGTTVEPETEALVTELVPGLGVSRGGLASR